MSENFYTILTATGKAKLANSAVLGSKVNFKTLKVGDGNGAYYEPTESQTSLVREVWSGNVSSISVDENNSNWIVAETLIPATIGGFFIREAGIFDEDGDLIAISKLSETYKPVVSEGSIKDLCIKIILEVSNVESVTLKIDPTVIVATRKDIDVLQAKMDVSNAKTAEEIKELDSKLSEQISELANEISNKTVVTPAIGYGMNNVIKNVGETSVSPKFTIQGKTVVNLLGKDGNCEDTSKWSSWQITQSLDSSNKLFGNNGFKLTLSGTQGTLVKPFVWDTTKWYCFSAYLKNGNFPSVGIAKDGSGGGVWKSSAYITDGTKFTRVFVKFQPSEIKANDYIAVCTGGTGASGQYGYVDGLMLEEITQAQYNDSNFQPSPYVDSYACLQNPYIEVRHDNLVRNGNCEEGIAWWNDQNTPQLTLENGYFKVTDDDNTSNEGCGQFIDVKEGATYTITAIAKCGTGSGTLKAQVSVIPQDANNVDVQTGRLTLTTTATSDTVLTGTITILAGVNKVRVFYGAGNSSDTGTYYFKNIHMVEGVVPPSQYLPCRIERCVLEGKFADGDSLVLENGEVTGQINWKHKTLFGKDYDWQYNYDFTGFKQISLSNMSNFNMYNWTLDKTKFLGFKYDGKPMVGWSSPQVTDGMWNDNNQVPSNIYLTVSDSDSGWLESINPNNDEVKAFMNGWKATYNNGTRYTCWQSIVDKSPCPAHIFTTIASSGTGSIPTLNDVSKFSVGDLVALYDSKTGVIYDSTTIIAINGNNVTLNQGTTGWTTGDYVVKQDVTILNYCKNNVVPGYEGYQLHYKLQNSETLTDINCHIHGDIPKLEVGDNYLFLDNGIVLSEVANPLSNGYNYFINNKDTIPLSRLKFLVDNILSVYKNNIYDFNKWTVRFGSFAYGCDTYISIANFDTSAIYRVDYKISSTIAPQIGSFICNYEQDIVTVINNIEESVNNKQSHDSVLDTIVDLSIYEKIIMGFTYTDNIIAGSSAYIDITIPCITKKVTPTITLQGKLLIQCGDGSWVTDITSKCTLYGVYYLNNRIKIVYSVSDSSAVNNIKNYGCQISGLTVVADCRGRL